jgi:phosphoribosyl-dephospho-CoA transferase
MFGWCVHDLLQISDESGLVLLEEQRCPSWVSDSLGSVPFVVVRRAESIDRMIPIGVRGPSRDQRFAGYLRAESVLRRIRPEQLLGMDHRLKRDRIIPALKAWDDVQQQLTNFFLTFGPTGSVGFELASGVSAVTATSDLDLLFRVPKQLPIAAARELVSFLRNRSCAVDAQLETPNGAISLAEYAEGRTPLLLRQNCGPILVEDPWRGSALAE